MHSCWPLAGLRVVKLVSRQNVKHSCGAAQTERKRVRPVHGSVIGLEIGGGEGGQMTKPWPLCLCL